VFTDFLLRRAGALRIIVGLLLAIALVLSHAGRTRLTKPAGRPTFREAFTDAFTADLLLVMLAAWLAWQGLLWLLAFLGGITL
jgi:hypothetical protein